MFFQVLKRIYQQLVLLAVVSLVLLAAYVSAGRQFMPAVSRYSDFFETQIFEFTGMPVSIESLVGGFEGFNPEVRINGLRLLVGEDEPVAPDPQASALIVDSATIIVDMPRSVWERRWVLEDFIIESLEVDVEQTQQGNWQLSGVNVAGDGVTDFDALFQAVQSLSMVTLTDVVINVQTRSGNRFTLNNGSMTIQNQGLVHYLHINANLDQSRTQIVISFEGEGTSLDNLDGVIHAQLPVANYTNVLRGDLVENLSLDEIIGGGDLWIDLDNGVITGSVSRLEVDSVTLSGIDQEPVLLRGLGGQFSLARGAAAGGWELALANMSVGFEEHDWRDFNLFFEWLPGENLSVRADNIDLALLTDVTLRTGLLSDGAREQLAGYAPAGALENVSLILPLAEDSEQHLQASSNLSNVQLGSVNGSPNMWGIDGYLEIDFDRTERRITGLAEVESNRFSINIPNVFTHVWDYSYVNGKLDIQVDLNEGQEIRLFSNPIIAESPAVDGRARFISVIHQYPDGERTAFLDLLVGAQRIDGELKTLYLPDGPNVADGLRANMEWLDRSVLDGDLYDSGVIFRGNTVQGSDPATKTFQSFFQLQNGELNYSDEWPRLNDLSAIVITDDGNIDIEVSSGSSFGIAMAGVQGRVRRDEAGDNWLDIDGRARGSTALGLNYLQQSPVDDGLKDAFADWQSRGDFDAGIQVRVPLGNEEEDTDVRLNIELADNSLTIPAYALELDQLNGTILFDTRSGLEPSSLQGRLFERPVTLNLSSQASAGEMEAIYVDAEGGATRQALVDWPLQSGFVRNLLSQMTGEIGYSARLSLPQGESGGTNNLAIDSDLRGASLRLPYPFAKTAAARLPLHLDLGFGDENTVAGTFGANLAFELDIQDGAVRDGVVYVGSDVPDLDDWDSDAVEGLAVVGELDRLVLEQWTGFLADVSSSGSPAGDLSQSIAFVDVQLDVLELYEQELPDVVMRIEPDDIDQGWLTRLISDSIQGWVVIPYQRDEYLRLDLEYLRLPGDEEETPIEDPDTISSRPREPEEEPVDVLADIDPRELPRMEFATDEFMIGSRPYGSWEFTLDPTAEGAELNNLIFDFRGLRLGLDELDPDDERIPAALSQGAPQFRWTFDGETHGSELRGVLFADDMAQVLQANGFAASFESDSALFYADVSWPGSPAFFSAASLSGDIDLEIEDGRFLQDSGGPGALKLISIINLDAIMRRLRFSDDMLRSGLAYDEISARLALEDGLVNIQDQLVISGPSSVYQITGQLNLAEETIQGEMYVTLPVSNNIPWLGLITGNLPLAVGAFLFDRIFGAQVDSLTSAVYTLEGPWEGLQPQFKQAFGSPDSNAADDVSLQ